LAPSSIPDDEIRRRVSEIRRRLVALADRSASSVRAVRRELSREIRHWAPRDVVRLATLLVAEPTIENRVVAYELLNHHRQALANVSAREVDRLGQGIDSWGAVDTFACYVAGPAWRMGSITDRTIHRWARSRDRWWRRAALVSTVPLNLAARGGSGDAARTIAVAELLVADRDDMVVKAMSWALRSLSVRDAGAVRSFLDQHAATLAPRVLREVRSKLDTGLKSPKRSQPKN
jgi:3-methyladenine DNA glycosylase AlkD